MEEASHWPLDGGAERATRGIKKALGFGCEAWLQGAWRVLTEWRSCVPLIVEQEGRRKELRGSREGR